MKPLRLSALICVLPSCLALAPAFAQGDDPQGYLEDPSNPRTEAFFTGQSAATRALLDRIGARAALRERIAQLTASQTLVEGLAMGGPRVFYLKLEPGAQAARLCMREGTGGAERVVFDPASVARDPTPAALAWISPSPDGRYVAVGVVHGAATQGVLRVVAADGGQLQPIEIDRVPRAAQVEWHPDGRSFYYPRAVEGSEGQARPAARIYRHILGRATDRDEIVFASGVGGALGVPEGSAASLRVPLESRHAYAVVPAADGNEIAVHVTELRELAAGKPRWRRVAGFEDDILAIEGWRDDLYLLSKRNAPRHRVLRMKAGATGVEGARVAVPEGDSVIRSMALARDALYLRTMVAGVDRLERMPLGLLAPRAPQFVRIPFDVAISQMVGQPRADGVLLRLEGWIEPPSLVYVDRHGDAQRLALQPATTADFSQVDEVRLYAPSTQGVKIPITLVYRKTTRLNHDNPTLLQAYGSYGVPLMPSFDAACLAWLEHGGVLAVAHLRGGGEYGEAWHEAGRGALKSNTVADLAAVGDFLVAYGFTSPRRLAVMGTGEGAVPAALAMERRPDLFAAGVFRAPLVDLPRAFQGAEGASLKAEFGADAAAVSPLQQVRQALPYPGVLVSARLDSLQAPPWHAGKLVAQLQSVTSSGRPVLLRTGEPARGERAARDEELADIYAFLLWQVGDPQFQGPPQASAGPVPAASR